MNADTTEGAEPEPMRLAQQSIALTRRELIEWLNLHLEKGLRQAHEIDKSLLTLSAGALLLSITFIGTLSDPKHFVGLLFAAWGCFIGSIVAVLFGMQKAYSSVHDSAVEMSENLERLSQMPLPIAASQRATYSVGKHEGVARLNQIAIWGFVLGVAFLCGFVGINLVEGRDQTRSSSHNRSA